MMRANLLRGFGVVGALVLAAGWGFLVPPGTARADHKPHHGGGGGGEETILFDVRVTGDMELVGTFNSQTCEILGDPNDPVAEGRADKSQVIVNRPSPAIQMDFLAVLECFTAGDIYSLDCGGDLVIIQARNGSARIEYYFLADGKNGQEQGYRVDGDAMIVADHQGSFPKGDSGYTVFVDNIRVSQDTGPRRNACEGSFPDALAVIRLDRQ